ncbi:MAG TPA: TetR/AcrR family transcriptional regulator [Acidimicrobiia bacterium]|jgi:AcrR family transcriptional regulator|nr:TetR/AcrR family transcriptional regulator [Acidimicrobiia bacterium]
MRSDARRNRARVLVAAEDVFSEMGLRAQIEEVARRAGVGVGTVCRHFPTKQALVEAVLEAMYESLLEDARHALDQADPGTAFHTFFVALSEFQARHRALAEHMATEIDLPVAAQSVRDALRGAIGELVSRAQDAGAIRPDIGPADVAMLFSGVAHATALAGDLRPVLRERYVALILDGLRPLEASPLPGQPLDFAQLQRLKAPPAR